MKIDFKKQRPLAIVHIDVDSLWTIAEDFGYFADSSDCSIYTQAIPRFLAMLNEYQIPATFFCIGADSTHKEQAEVMQSIVAHGHEIGNHTMNHRQDFGQLTPSDKRKEIVECDNVLRDIINTEIVGFRSPGYYFDDSIYPILQELGYTYDTSILPTPFLFYFAMARFLLSGGIRTRKRFGRLRDAWSTLYPHFFLTSRDYSNITSKLVEIPISVIPIVRLPFHSTFVFMSGLWLFGLGTRLIRSLGLPLVYVFHAADLLPDTNNMSAKRHPTLQRSYNKRYANVAYMLRAIKSDFEVVTTCSFVNYFKGSLLG